MSGLEGPAAVVVGVSALVVALVRHPGNVLDDVWAEDGSRFLTDAYQAPLYRTVLEPYSAYLHLYPRLVGAVAAAVPVADAATVLSIGGALASAAAAAGMVLHLGRLVPALAVRLAAGLAVALLPAGVGDPTANVANAHWWLLVLGLTASLWRPRRAAGEVWVRVAVVLAVGSDPAGIGLAPLLAVRLAGSVREVRTAPGGRPSGARRRLAADLVTVGLWAVVGAVQVVTVVLNRDDYTRLDVVGRPGVGQLLGLLARQSLGMTLLGREAARTAPAWALVALAAGLVLVVASATAADRRRGLLSVLLVALAVVYGIVPPYLKWQAVIPDTSEGVFPAVPRYSVVPSCLLVAVVAVCVAVLLRERAPRTRRGPVARAVVGLATLLLLSVFAATLVGGPPRPAIWRSGVAAAAARCRADPVPRVLVRASPPFGWFAAVPCDRLTDTAEPSG